MDFYSYYRERFGWGPNPYSSVAQCQRIVAEMLDNPVIPPRIAAESAVGFLSALTDFAGDGCSIVRAYDTIMDSTIDALQRMRDAANEAEQAWLPETQELEQEACGGPPYDPEEFETWPVDIDTGEDEEEPDGEASDGEPQGMIEAIQEYFCANCEAGAGVRRPYPDWEHWNTWTDSDWLRFQIYKKKMLAVAAQDFFAMGTVTNALAAAKAHVGILPVSRQVEVALWCQELVDELSAHMETNLQELCAGTLYTPAGRAAQKQLFSTASDSAWNEAN